MIKVQKNVPLARHIKWAIGNRIILCLISLSVVVLLSSLTDIMNGCSQITAKLHNDSKILSEHIVAQSLIGNEPGIIIKLKELNEIDEHVKFQWQPQANILDEPKMKWVLPFSWAYLYPVRDNDGNPYGEILISSAKIYHNSILFQLIAKMTLLLIFSIIIFILLYPLSNRIPQHLFIKPILNLLALLKNRSNVLENSNSTLPFEFREIEEKINQLLNEVTENTRKIALGQMAAQVAHDIRSPLTALDIVVKNIVTIPEDQRILIRTAINRIHDIANNLLNVHGEKLIDQNENQNIAECITDLVLSLVSEKRVQNKDNKISFDVNIQDKAYLAFAHVTPTLLKRVLSNLIDNAIESIEVETGVISVMISSNDHAVLISIQDNGCGIKTEMLQAIRAGKITTNKKNGHGLGLSYAIRTINDMFNGRFNIESIVGIGTKLEITLPSAPIPKWIASQLLMSSSATIVIVDDDESIHQVWRERFKVIGDNFNLIHHYNPRVFLTWHKDNSFTADTYLIDYEFVNCNRNGLSIIEKLNIADRSYLVTSRHEDLNLREESERIGLKIIPKSLAVYIPIILLKENAAKQADLIFIDDDITITGAWVLHGLTKGMIVATYNSINTFKADLDQFNMDTPIFIDSDLNEEVKGEDLAKELYDKGYENLYLATGYLSGNSPKMYWIKETIGKAPPF